MFNNDGAYRDTGRPICRNTTKDHVGQRTILSPANNPLSQVRLHSSKS